MLNSANHSMANVLLTKIYRLPSPQACNACLGDNNTCGRQAEVGYSVTSFGPTGKVTKEDQISVCSECAQDNIGEDLWVIEQVKQIYQGTVKEALIAVDPGIQSKSMKCKKCGNWAEVLITWQDGKNKQDYDILCNSCKKGIRPAIYEIDRDTSSVLNKSSEQI